MHTLRYISIMKERGCGYCHTEIFEDQWTHHRKCKNMSGEMYARCEKELVKKEELAHSIWKAFIERRFEPHTFFSRYKNFKCEYCMARSNIYHAMKCKLSPMCIKEVIKKIYYWKEG